MKRITLISIAASVVVATTTLADSQTASGDAEILNSDDVPGMSFTDMDTNVDGMVTVEEYDAARSNYMQGEEAGSEYGAGDAAGSLPELISHGDMDLNGDGMVTEGEYLEARTQFIERRR